MKLKTWKAFLESEQNGPDWAAIERYFADSDERFDCVPTTVREWAAVKAQYDNWPDSMKSVNNYKKSLGEIIADLRGLGQVQSDLETMGLDLYDLYEKYLHSLDNDTLNKIFYGETNDATFLSGDASDDAEQELYKRNDVEFYVFARGLKIIDEDNEDASEYIDKFKEITGVNLSQRHKDTDMVKGIEDAMRKNKWTLVDFIEEWDDFTFNL